MNFARGPKLAHGLCTHHRAPCHRSLARVIYLAHVAPTESGHDKYKLRFINKFSQSIICYRSGGLGGREFGCWCLGCFAEGDSQNDYNSAPCSRLSHALSDVGTHRLSSLVPLTVDTPSEDRGFY
ncbi:hypothetical protein PC121_g11853 [Phytophthora cactorum]|nr:hypothetical protein PC121_g11853 [Phytophthora cactorum]